jgi:phosphinothricin acetyltransferase
VEIVNHYIMHSHATFDTEPYTIEERTSWFESYGDGRYRLLVAEYSNQILGCCYSNRLKPAFDMTVETSIYLNPECRGRGTGTALYTALFRQLEEQPVHLAVAGIALPNEASIALHRKFDFEEVGTFREYARKGERLISSTWFQRRIQPR